jgi:hypothetical protein
MTTIKLKALTNKERWVSLLALGRICRERVSEDNQRYFTEMPPPDKTVNHNKLSGGVYSCSKLVNETDARNLFSLVKRGDWFFNTPINGDALIYKDRGESIKIIDGFHLIDPADHRKNTGHVFSLRMLSNHILQDKNFRQYEIPHTRPDVVLSSSFQFVIDNLQQAVDLEVAMLNADDMPHGHPVSLEVVKNDTVLFSIDLDFAKPAPDGAYDQYTVNLDEIKVVGATLEDIKQMGSILSPNQLRQLRGQVLEDSLGL